jgi:anti-sigma factor RsiW
MTTDVPATPELPEELLSAYLDDECDADERAAVEARLTTDAEWRTILDEITETRAVVRALPQREPPAGFFEKLDPRPWSKTARWISGVAAVAAVAAGFMLAAPSSSHDDVTPPIAALADSHGATQSLATDPISALAPLAVATPSTP